MLVPLKLPLSAIRSNFVKIRSNLNSQNHILLCEYVLCTLDHFNLIGKWLLMPFCRYVNRSVWCCDFPLDGICCCWCSFLAFQASFYRISANCALRFTHTHTHYPQSPNLEDRKLSLSQHALPAYQRIFYFILVLMLMLIFIFHTPLFHDLPVFHDDIFRAPKWQKESEKNISSTLRNLYIDVRIVEWKGGKQQTNEQKWIKTTAKRYSIWTFALMMRSSLFNCRLPEYENDVQRHAQVQFSPIFSICFN